MTRSLTRHTTIFVVVVVAIVVVACGVGDLQLAGKACPCVAGFTCDTTTNTCVAVAVVDAGPPLCADAGCACSAAAPCLDPAFPACVAGQCVACSTAPDSCQLGYYCVDTKNCALGCKGNDCAQLSPNSAPFCSPTQLQCVECLTQGDCSKKPGTVCSPSGSCAATCDADASLASCPTGQSCCAGLCIDTTTDVNNCGACEAPCTGSLNRCCSGKCTNSLTSPTNCGACNAPCSTTNNTPSCAAGACSYACNAGFCPGSNGCFPPSNTVNQCGVSCSNCAATVLNATGISCSTGGSPSCDYVACTGYYIDNDGDRTNGCETRCGGDNEVCCPGSSCHNGMTCTGSNHCPDS